MKLLLQRLVVLARLISLLRIIVIVIIIINIIIIISEAKKITGSNKFSPDQNTFWKKLDRFPFQRKFYYIFCHDVNRIS